MTSKIRTARDSDREVLRRLVAEMQDHERAIAAWLPPGREMAAAYTDAVIAACDAPPGRIFVAEVDGEVAGFVAVQAGVPNDALDEAPGTVASITDLVVTSARRGAGVGRSLLEAAEAYARAHGATEIRIEVLDGNDVADRLYRAAGYRPYVRTLRKRFGAGSDD